MARNLARGTSRFEAGGSGPSGTGYEDYALHAAMGNLRPGDSVIVRNPCMMAEKLSCTYVVTGDVADHTYCLLQPCGNGAQPAKDVIRGYGWSRI
ncbi:MAG: hypothetical protein HY367_00335 [Candidatus Aenigmarchaeota archaeon]|nr:hypothetical protein [Candidatus Aenigmarchaeota archaeon]